MGHRVAVLSADRSGRSQPGSRRGSAASVPDGKVGRCPGTQADWSTRAGCDWRPERRRGAASILGLLSSSRNAAALARAARRRELQAAPPTRQAGHRTEHKAPTREQAPAKTPEGSTAPGTGRHQQPTRPQAGASDRGRSRAAPPTRQAERDRGRTAERRATGSTAGGRAREQTRKGAARGRARPPATAHRGRRKHRRKRQRGNEQTERKKGAAHPQRPRTTAEQHRAAADTTEPREPEDDERTIRASPPGFVRRTKTQPTDRTTRKRKGNALLLALLAAALACGSRQLPQSPMASATEPDLH